MQDQNGKTERATTIRDRLDRLHTLLTETLAAEAQIIGNEPVTDEAIAKEPGTVLSAIERDLDRAIDKASRVANGLRQIANRL